MVARQLSRTRGRGVLRELRRRARRAAVEPHELIACGDRVVSLGEERARVRATGEHLAVPFVHVIRVRADRVSEVRGHVDTAAVVRAFEPANVAS